MVRFRFDLGESYALAGRMSRDGFLYLIAATDRPEGDLTITRRGETRLMANPSGEFIRNVILTGIREGRELHLMTDGEPSGMISLDGGMAAYRDWFGRLQTQSNR